ncbi:penicillin-binding protein activator LpoB [Dysgonomonas sp. ZJ709]|uniref:penicillin-binding protein activator LpoB n=1 Tax=Dysgonomonas sp. ZJ709 TaxID=2709797 RepID=UPI0013EA9C35|nr:penicillin-binding protein activator LpoB [Dysgonomonas sp. ZJ709]
MKNLLMSVLVLFVLTPPVFAQGGKEIVYIENLSHTNNIGSSHVEGLRNKVIEGLVKTERVVVKDVNSEASLKREAQKQTEDAANVDESTLLIMKNLNAKYLVQGHVTTLEPLKVTDSEGKISYRGSIVYALKIIDIQAGTMKGTESYTYAGSGSGILATGTGDTPDKAIASTMNAVEKDMLKLVNKYFPIEGTILEVNAEKKGKATEVYIDLGTIAGMKKGQDFDVFMEREVAGRKSQKKIGELEVQVVEGDDISLCKVKKGGEEIKAAIGEGLVVTIKSSYKETLFGI